MKKYILIVLGFWHQEIKPMLAWPLFQLMYMKAARRATQEMKLERVAEKRLEKLLRLAVQSVPYYRSVYQVYGYGKGSEISSDDFQNLPTINRQALQKYHRLFFRHGRVPITGVYHVTSGTTNQPLEVPVSIFRTVRESVDRALHARLQKLDLSTFRLFGNNFAHITDSFGNTTSNRISDFKVSRITRYAIPLALSDDAKKMIRRIEVDNPSLVSGKPSSLIHLATLCRKLGYPKKQGIQPSFIYSGAEHLSVSDRQLLEEVFQSKVYEHYGTTEIGVFGRECRYHDGFHYASDRFIVEIIPIEGRTPEDDPELGEIVVTELTNRQFPLIRYRTGDVGKIAPTPCLCGSLFPRIMLCDGRLIQFFISESGYRVNPFGLTLQLRLLPLRDYQIIQRNTEQVLVRYVGELSSRLVVEAVLPEARRLLGTRIDVLAEQVYSVREHGKKFMPYLCLVSHPEPTGL